MVQSLLDAEMVGREYLIVCRQDSHTVCSVQEKSKLTDDAGASLKCTICGRLFRDELEQLIFVISDAGTRLLNGSAG